MDHKRIQTKIGQKIFKPLYTKKYTTVEESHHQAGLKPDAELFIFKIASKYLAFSRYKMMYHHIAQGYVDDEPYMLTFCGVCNSGMVMNPVVDHQMLHFYIYGSYNGMLLMADKETNSYWDHITGKCLDGKYKGHQLEILQSHQVLTTQEVLQQYPDCLYGVEELNFFQSLFTKFMNAKINTRLAKPFFPPGFRKSMKVIDDRLPEMEMGLGVWQSPKKAKFYPLSVIKKHNNYLWDSLGDRNILIYISPSTHTPCSIYVDNRATVSFEGHKLNLSDGRYIDSGTLYSDKGEKLKTESPNYVFLRWYGFISTFPNSEMVNKVST